jgi:hypothetical protein
MNVKEVMGRLRDQLQLREAVMNSIQLPYCIFRAACTILQ